MKNKKNLTKRREFLKKAGLVSAGAIGASTLAAPYGYAATNPIKWRLQTYSGAPLGASFCPSLSLANKLPLLRNKSPRLNVLSPFLG